MQTGVNVGQKGKDSFYKHQQNRLELGPELVHCCF